MLTKINFILILILFQTTNAFCWNAYGHRLVAVMAYNQLSGKKKKEMVAVLKKHPFITKWDEEYKNYKPVDYGAFLFMKASTYPDDIRKSGNPNDHPVWHYIDYKISADGKDEKAIMNPDENIVKALQLNIDLMKNEAMPDSTKAIALCWIIHLTGDIHQPLHCAEYFSDLFPDGDKGGNSIYIKPDATGGATRLHGYWDALAGTSDDYLAPVTVAKSLIKKFPVKTNPTMNAVSITDWSDESFMLAKTVAYENGKIPASSGVTKKDTAPLLTDAADYNKSCSEVAEKRIAFSAFRLSNLMKGF
ncbi:MAG: S1/P1 nuclease [Bacteroidota bacterium]